MFGDLGEDFTIKTLMPTDDYSELFKVVEGESLAYTYAMSNQSMRISGTYRHDTSTNDDFISISPSTARSPRTYLAASDAVTDAFRPWMKNGVVIDPWALLSEIKEIRKLGMIIQTLCFLEVSPFACSRARCIPFGRIRGN